MKCEALIDPETRIALEGDALVAASKNPDSPRCGYELEAGDVFCPSCGARTRIHEGSGMLREEFMPEVGTAAENACRVKLPKISAKALKITGGVIAAMVLVGGLICYVVSIRSSDSFGGYQLDDGVTKARRKEMDVTTGLCVDIRSSDPFGGYQLDDVVTKAQRKEMDIATGQNVDRRNSIYHPPEHEQKFVNQKWDKRYVSTLMLTSDGRVKKIVTERDFDKDLDMARTEYDKVVAVCQKLYGMSKWSRNFDEKSRETVFSVFPECKVRVSLRDLFGARVSIELDFDDEGRPFRPMVDTKVNGSMTWTAFFEEYRSKEKEFLFTLESNYPQRPSEEGLETCSACISSMIRLCGDVKTKIAELPDVGRLELEFMTKQAGRYQIFVEKLKSKVQARTFKEKMKAIEDDLPYFEIYSARRDFIRKHSPLGTQAVEIVGNKENGDAPKLGYDEKEASEAVDCAAGILDGGSILRRSDEQKAALRQVRFFAEKGYVPAQYLLATLILAHKVHDDEDKPEKAVELLGQAVGKGHIPSMRKLGQCLLDGTGVAANSDKAAVLLKSAAEGGDGIACIVLARLYRDGKCVKKDEAKVTELANKGIAILKPLALKGNAEACSLIGQCYQLGMGVKEDHDQALSWYNMSTKFMVARAFDGPSRLLGESKKTKELMKRPIPAIGGVMLGKKLAPIVETQIGEDGELWSLLEADGLFAQYSEALCKALPVSKRVYAIFLAKQFETREEADMFFDSERKQLEKTFGFKMITPREERSSRDDEDSFIKRVQVVLHDFMGKADSIIQLHLMKGEDDFCVLLTLEDKCSVELAKELSKQNETEKVKRKKTGDDKL